MEVTHPETCAFPLQHGHNEQEERCDDGCLDAEGLQGAVLRRPWHLEVGDAEPSQCADEVDQRRDLALCHSSFTQSSTCTIRGTHLARWKAVVAVRIHSYSSDHDGHLRYAPAHDEGADAEMLLEGRAQHQEPAHVQRHRDVDCPVRCRYQLGTFGRCLNGGD